MTEKRLFLGTFFFSFHLHYVCFLSASGLQKLIRPCQAYEKARGDKTTASNTWIKISYSFNCCKEVADSHHSLCQLYGAGKTGPCPQGKNAFRRDKNAYDDN